MKRAWIENDNGTYNLNFSVEDRSYKIGEIIVDRWGVKHKVIFDDPVAVRVKMINEQVE